ncbi:MAG: hypothetical protein Q7S86_05645, partial [bacterium]|nr:hypothetical protein [bacterium]
NTLEPISPNIQPINSLAPRRASVLAPLADSRGRPSPCRSHTFFFGGEDFLNKEWRQDSGGNGSFPPRNGSNGGNDPFNPKAVCGLRSVFSALWLSSIGKGNPPLGIRLVAVSAMATSA